MNDVLKSVEKLPDQCLQAWEETQKIEFDARYKEIWNVAVCGMGASGLPAHIINSAFPANVPVVSVNAYDLPSWAHEHTLAYLSSYSGNTEEILSCAEQAKKSNCMVTGSSEGGKLAEFFKSNNYSAYVYDPKHNPAKQPRMGLGYGVFGQLGILAKLGVVSAVEGPLGDQVKRGVGRTTESKGKIQQAAKKLAETIKDRALLIFAADHLIGNAHAFANQANETSKTAAFWFSIPEANHHLLEGLKHPKIPLTAIFLESNNYFDPVKKRIELTKKIVEKNGHETQSYRVQQGTLLEEMLDALMFSSFTTVYLADHYREDPLAIPWVDSFKKELEKTK
ncbi:hypothetical protein CMO96_03350 [Candidatus Woesebacteria bacterium]|nr:hypothetical protein [Candidatus Woesebacteria bacterium]